MNNSLSERPRNSAKRAKVAIAGEYHSWEVREVPKGHFKMDVRVRGLIIRYLWSSIFLTDILTFSNARIQVLLRLNASSFRLKWSVWFIGSLVKSSMKNWRILVSILKYSQFIADYCVIFNFGVYCLNVAHTTHVLFSSEHQTSPIYLKQIKKVYNLYQFLC